MAWPSAETASIWAIAGVDGAVRRDESTSESPRLRDSQILPCEFATTDRLRLTPSVLGRPSFESYSRISVTSTPPLTILSRGTWRTWLEVVIQNQPLSSCAKPNT